MNSPHLLAPWLAPLGWLALEATVVILAALALQPLLRTAAARRTLWRAALLALVAVLAAELTGTGSQLPAQLRLAWQTTFPKPAPPLLTSSSTPELSFTPAPVFPLAPIGGEGRGEGAFTAPEPLQFEPAASLPPSPRSLSHSPTFSPTFSPAPALLWLTGIVALLARSAWTHAGFAWLRLRHFIPAAEALRERVAALAARLGLRRRVRVLASERLRTPAAFGWLRPGVVVPGDFTARFAPAQQDVMLAHELAHLAARDPLWQLLADLAAAALWWHPLVWVARRQHRLAGELAADDASLALPDGPVVLAECLLALGHEAADCPRAALGMAGFRSQLGRRVERLVALPPGDWQPAGKLRSFAQTASALVLLAALALLPGCAANRTATEAPTRTVAKWWQAKKSPAGDDVRSLTSADSGQRTAVSKKLLTSLPTNDQPVLIQGRVLFSGTPPAEHNIPLPPTVLVARTNAPMKTRFYRVATDGGLADVVVYVKAGLPKQDYHPLSEAVVVHAQNYEFQPYISAVQVGQPVIWDSVRTGTVGVQVMPTNYPNRQFSRVVSEEHYVENTFPAPELFIRGTVYVYPWMMHYLSVFDHPYFAVTDAEGRFRFPQALPPGKYTLAAVHRQTDESLQELDLTQPLPAGQPLDVPFVMAAKVFPPYRFAVGDVLKVDIYQRSDLRKETRVLPSGDIELPLIGAIPVAGKTISEVRAAIKKAYEPAHVETAHVNVVAVQTDRPFAPGPLLFTPKRAADFAASAPLPRAEFLERKARVEAEIKEAEKTFPPAHPKMLGLRNQLESVEEALKQLRLAPQELASVRFQLGRFISVGTRLQTANFSTLERLALLATCSGMIQGTASSRGINTWEDLERQKLSLERTIKEQLRTYPAGHLKMKELFSQREALEVALVAELKQALARFETVKQDLIRREEQLSRLMGESQTKPPAPAKPGASLPAPVGADVRRLTSPQPPNAIPQTPPASQRLVTSSPTNALDISVGRQLFVDDFLIASNSLQRMWHQPIVSDLPQRTVMTTGALRGEFPFPADVWYDTAIQEFRLRIAFRTNSAEFRSPSGTNWPAHPRLLAIAPPTGLTERPKWASTDYESHRVTLHRVYPRADEPSSSGLYLSVGWRGVPASSFSPERVFIPAPRPADGSQWSDLHPLTNGFLVVGRNLHFYFGGRVQKPGETHANAAVGLATLRRDGFASLDAGPEGGVMTTKPVTFTGNFMFVNLKTNAPDGELRIEIVHPDGRPIVVTHKTTPSSSPNRSRSRTRCGSPLTKR